MFNPKLFSVLLAIALTTQRVNAGLGCNGRHLLDEYKCWVNDINRVFGGSLDYCDYGYHYANSESDCAATAAKINAHPEYDGPTVSCIWNNVVYSGVYGLFFDNDADCDVGSKKLEAILLAITTTTTTTTVQLFGKPRASATFEVKSLDRSTGCSSLSGEDAIVSSIYSSSECSLSASFLNLTFVENTEVVDGRCVQDSSDSSVVVFSDDFDRDTWIEVCKVNAYCSEQDVLYNIDGCSPDNELEALKYFGYVGGGIAVALGGHYIWNVNFRDVELYLIVGGGLLDATTDLLYLNFETFYNPTLQTASIIVMSLPIVVILITFWSGMTTDYSKQRWRIIFIPIEGPITLLIVLMSSAYFWTSSILKTVVSNCILKPIKAIYNSVRGLLSRIYNYTYKEITVVTIGDGRQVEQRFYHRGLTQFLLAFLGIPIFMLAVVLITPVVMLVIVIIGIGITVVGVSLSISVATVGSILIPTLFSVSAFLRLFVISPFAWKSLADITERFAQVAIKGCPFTLLSDERLEKARHQVFNIDNDTKNRIDDLKISSIKYLAVEFVLEAVPQIIIQSLNNKTRQTWSPIGITSMVISIYAIVNSFFKYGYLYICAPDVVKQMDKEVVSNM